MNFFSLDKEAFCAEFNTTLPFQNMTLLDCNYIECCSGDNCNSHNLTVIPTKATATPAPFPTTSKYTVILTPEVMFVPTPNFWRTWIQPLSTPLTITYMVIPTPDYDTQP